MKHSSYRPHLSAALMKLISYFWDFSFFAFGCDFVEISWGQIGARTCVIPYQIPHRFQSVRHLGFPSEWLLKPAPRPANGVRSPALAPMWPSIAYRTSAARFSCSAQLFLLCASAVFFCLSSLFYFLYCADQKHQQEG